MITLYQTRERNPDCPEKQDIGWKLGQQPGFLFVPWRGTTPPMELEAGHLSTPPPHQIPTPARVGLRETRRPPCAWRVCFALSSGGPHTKREANETLALGGRCCGKCHSDGHGHFVELCCSQPAFGGHVSRAVGKPRGRHLSGASLCSHDPAQLPRLLVGGGPGSSAKCKPTNWGVEVVSDV